MSLKLQNGFLQDLRHIIYTLAPWLPGNSKSYERLIKPWA